MSKLNRREMLWALGAAGLFLPSACGSGGRARADAAPVRAYAYQPYVAEAKADGATPRADACVETEDNIEGPYYRRGAPWREDLAAGRRGTALVLSGTVAGADCRPLERAVLDIWQADHDGHYDNDGSRDVAKDQFELRGRVKTGVRGEFTLKTIVPGRYLLGEKVFRPAHIHVKVAAEKHRTLTTQLYFPDDPWNDRDPFIKSSLLMKMSKADGTLVGSFDFVLAAG